MGKHVEKPSQAQGRDDKGRKHFKECKTCLGRRFHSLIILAVFLWATTRAFGLDFQVAVEKNLFSPDRRYEPYFSEKKGGVHQDILKRSLILRGTLVKGRERLAVIEVLPAARRELGLEDTKQRRFVVTQGEDLGDCPVLEIRPEEVILGGRCQGLTLTLEDSPERKRPAPAEKKAFKRFPIRAQSLQKKDLNRPKKAPRLLRGYRAPHPFPPGKPPVE